MRYCQPAGILLSPVKSVSVLFRRVSGTSVRRRMSGPGPEKEAGKKFVFSSPAPFTLIELLVITAQQNCLFKTKKQHILTPGRAHFTFAAGKLFTPSHLHSISVHADRTPGCDRHYCHSCSNAAPGFE